VALADRGWLGPSMATRVLSGARNE
jgi:hypothetical protein